MNDSSTTIECIGQRVPRTSCRSHGTMIRVGCRLVFEIHPRCCRAGVCCLHCCLLSVNAAPFISPGAGGHLACFRLVAITSHPAVIVLVQAIWFTCGPISAGSGSGTAAHGVAVSPALVGAAKHSNHFTVLSEGSRCSASSPALGLGDFPLCQPGDHPG